MSVIRNLVSAVVVSAGGVAAFGLLFLAAAPSAQAAVVGPGPVVAACSGACTFSNGKCRSDPTDDCTGTGCSCKGDRTDCGCKK